MPIKKPVVKSTSPKEEKQHVCFIVKKSDITTITFDFNSKKFVKILLIYSKILSKKIEIRKAQNKHAYYFILRWFNIQYLKYENWFNSKFNKKRNTITEEFS